MAEEFGRIESRYDGRYLTVKEPDGQGSPYKRQNEGDNVLSLKLVTGGSSGPNINLSEKMIDDLITLLEYARLQYKSKKEVKK